MTSAPTFRLPCLLVLLLAAAFPLSAQRVQITQVGPPQAWQLAEFRVAGIPSVKNPFDPDQVRVDATFTLPSGRRMTIPAFWYQGFTRERVEGREVLTPAGAPGWRLRFTPPEAGAYGLSLTVAIGGRPAEAPVVTHFTVAPAPPNSADGWVRIAADHRDFTAGGSVLRLVGANVCWAEQEGTFDYDRWFGSMHAAGENFARLWMSPWWAGIEHGVGTLNHYDLKSAWELDHIFRLADRDDIYLMLCFDHHGMFQEDNRNWGGSNNFWKVNPYNAANGGPCATPDAFFTSPAARMIYEKRLRYLVARYGYSPHLLAWQFMNEIDNVFGPGRLQEGDVVAWHRAVGRWMHAHDPYQHLVTTSLTGGSDRPAIWDLPELDFTSYHSYFEPATIRSLPTLIRSFLRRYHKPMMIGEFGISANGWDLAADPYLRGFRQGVWTGALGGSVGSAMSWWWQDIDRNDVYPLYAAMTHILRRAGWYGGTWAPITFGGQETPPTDLGAVVAAGMPFTAQLHLNGSWRSDPSDQCAVAGPLAAARSAEQLGSYLQGSAHAARRRPIRLTAWFGEKAKAVIHVKSVAHSAGLAVRVDGTEVLHQVISGREGKGRGHELNRDFTVDLPAGRHVLEIANTGQDWMFLDSIRLEQVRPARFVGDWHFGPAAVGLRRDGRGLLYVCSPWVVYPADAHVYNPPLQQETSVVLKDWPAGRYRAEWFDPTTGTEVGRTKAMTAGGELRLPLPSYRDDLAGIVTRESAE